MKFILLILLIAVAAILFLASRKPTTQKILRKTSINAPKAKVYGHIASLRAYNEWNPFADMDPNQTTTFDGEDGAIGSSMSWKGKKTGEGSMTLAEANGTDAVRYDMAFVKPMKGAGVARMSLVEQDEATVFSWDISIEQSFVARIFAVFMNIEKMMGPLYDKGLAKLKALSEA